MVIVGNWRLRVMGEMDSVWVWWVLFILGIGVGRGRSMEVFMIVGRMIRRLVFVGWRGRIFMLRDVDFIYIWCSLWFGVDGFEYSGLCDKNYDFLNIRVLWRVWVSVIEYMGRNKWREWKCEWLLV